MLIFKHANTYIGRSLIYRRGARALSWGIWSVRKKHRNAMLQEWRTQEAESDRNKSES